ncbi:MAG: flavin reductase family protein [Clostridiales bacterium]|nr:flavin reductase family protein [Clostridiales bacterium]
MLKDLGVKPYTFPMPVLMISTYNEDGSVDVMNMAWGGVCAENMVALNIDEDHKTSENIMRTGAFTLSIADVDHIEAADYFGIATGNKVKDKFARSGLHAIKSTRVDAPIVEEFPLTLECNVVECQHTIYGFRVLGEIVNVLADEKVLDEKGKVDPTKLNAFVFDQFKNGYYAIGEKVGQAWNTGAKLMKKGK